MNTFKDRRRALKLTHLESTVSVAQNAATIGSKEKLSTSITTESTTINFSKRTVSLEQIQALEAKIATLNQQIASIMHRSLEA